MSRVAKTERKKKVARNQVMDRLQQWQAINLARCGGFSHRFIASLVFGKPLEAVADKERSCVSGCLHRAEVKVTNWRNGLTPMAMAHAKGLLKPRSRAEKAASR